MTQPSVLPGNRPAWVTFDCYGTLARWDEGLLEVVNEILSRRDASGVDARRFIEVYDRHEHAAEQTPPHRSFKEVSALSLRAALEELGLSHLDGDAELLTGRIASMPPFPEVPTALERLARAGFRLCVISNTDDDLIAGNVAQMGGHLDRVISAEQAGAYKPSRRIFEYAHAALGVSKADVVHVCASPHLDLAAAREMGFRCVWVDRGTGREPLPDYVPDATVASLEAVVELFEATGWMGGADAPT